MWTRFLKENDSATIPPIFSRRWTLKFSKKGGRYRSKPFKVSLGVMLQCLWKEKKSTRPSSARCILIWPINLGRTSRFLENCIASFRVVTMHSSSSLQPRRTLLTWERRRAHVFIFRTTTFSRVCTRYRRSTLRPKRAGRRQASAKIFSCGSKQEIMPSLRCHGSFSKSIFANIGSHWLAHLNMYIYIKFENEFYVSFSNVDIRQWRARPHNSHISIWIYRERDWKRDSHSTIYLYILFWMTREAVYSIHSYATSLLVLGQTTAIETIMRVLTIAAVVIFGQNFCFFSNSIVTE